MSQKRTRFNAIHEVHVPNLPDIDPDRPVLIAGPTASGKSALALEIAARHGGVIVNADALQVFDGWRVLTARPSLADETRTEHRLYGHVPYDGRYSVGHWLRQIAPILADGRQPVIVGGTGLYFSALTGGLSDIPPTPPQIRARADARRASKGLAAMLAELDPATRARIDPLNGMRVQRAWEVAQTTGRGLAAWQDETPPPLLPLTHVQALVLNARRDWLNRRIEVRFDAMIAAGALDEARANLGRWDPALQSSRAIGAAPLIGYLRGEMSLAEARDKAIIATRQFAKRQRSWFRARMQAWTSIDIG